MRHQTPAPGRGSGRGVESASRTPRGRFARDATPVEWSLTPAIDFLIGAYERKEAAHDPLRTGPAPDERWNSALLRGRGGTKARWTSFRKTAEKRALAARGEELRESRTELRDRVRIFEDVMRANRAEAKRATEIMQRRIGVLREARAAIERANASKALAARALLDLELISAEVEQTFLHAWLDELEPAGVSALGS